MSIKLKNVTVDYGSMYAVNNLSLEIETGKLACLLGPSGCGKTTTLFAMAGLLNVSQGQIFFHDKDVTKTPPKDRKIGLVFQNYALYPHLDVMDNIAFPLHQNKKIKIDIKNHNLLIKHKIQNLKSCGLNTTKFNFQKELLDLLTDFIDSTYNQIDNQAREINNIIWELQKKEINLIYKNPNLDLLKNVMLSKWRYKVLLFIYSQKHDAFEKLWKNVYAQVLDFYYGRLKEIAQLDSLEKKQKKNDFKHTYNIFYSLLNQIYTTKTQIIHSKLLETISNIKELLDNYSIEYDKVSYQLNEKQKKHPNDSKYSFDINKDEFKALLVKYSTIIQEKLDSYKFEIHDSVNNKYKNLFNTIIIKFDDLSNKYIKKMSNNDFQYLEQEEYNEKLKDLDSQYLIYDNEIKKRVEEVARKVNIFDQLSKKPSELSGGQQQRVAIARAIVKEPDILLLDEPLSNLDAKLRVSTRAWIKKLQTDAGITTVFVTHDQEEAMSISDQIFIMNRGVLQQSGSPQEIHKNPYNKFIASFIGIPSMNMFKGVVSDQKIYLLTKDEQKTNKKLLIGNLSKKAKDVWIGIRPEKVILNSKGKHNGTIKIIELLGHNVNLSIDWLGQEIKILSNIDETNKLKVGDNLSFDFKDGETYIFHRFVKDPAKEEDPNYVVDYTNPEFEKFLELI